MNRNRVKKSVSGKIYTAPQLQFFGRLSEVTQKSGVNADLNHPDRPKKGGGNG